MLFKKIYTIRRQGADRIVDGYATKVSVDLKIQLNVQPLKSSELIVLPEGDRSVKHLKVFAKNRLLASDEKTKKAGDLLYYENEWYACKSVVHWQHGILKHFEAEFVLLPNQENYPPPKERTQDGW